MSDLFMKEYFDDKIGMGFEDVLKVLEKRFKAEFEAKRSIHTLQG